MLTAGNRPAFSLKILNIEIKMKRRKIKMAFARMSYNTTDDMGVYDMLEIDPKSTSDRFILHNLLDEFLNEFSERKSKNKDAFFKVTAKR